jgi:hypothetical protein
MPPRLIMVKRKEVIMMKRFLVIMFLTLPLIAAGMASAGEADVLQVKATRSGETWSFSVTVQHADEGWDHYSDRWEVLTTDGELLATRVLAHPHVGEQPFTRGMAGIEIPGGVTEVVVRARDLVHGYGGKELTVDLGTQN